MFSVQSFTALRMLRPNSLQVQQCILQAGRNTLQNWGPIICTCCQELCFVRFLLKEGKDVMQGVYNPETFPCFMPFILQRCCYCPSFKSNLPHNENLISLSCKFPGKALCDYYKVFFSHKPMFLFIFSKYNKGISVFSISVWKRILWTKKKLLFFLSNLSDLLN